MPLSLHVEAGGACQGERDTASCSEIIIVRTDEGVGMDSGEAPLVDVQGVVRVEFECVDVPFVPHFVAHSR
jgi:hypothetical protein